MIHRIKNVGQPRVRFPADALIQPCYPFVSSLLLLSVGNFQPFGPEPHLVTGKKLDAGQDSRHWKLMIERWQGKGLGVCLI
jgi:hypothetical protein